jgi:hypothetical protein
MSDSNPYVGQKRLRPAWRLLLIHATPFKLLHQHAKLPSARLRDVTFRANLFALAARRMHPGTLNHTPRGQKRMVPAHRGSQLENALVGSRNGLTAPGMALLWQPTKVPSARLSQPARTWP